MDKISVIVPVYNVEKYLDKCVDSIVNQTYKNLEIILVDDGSPDNCPGLCDAWAKKDERIKVIHKENGGVSSARNAGIEIMTGKYVSFIDSDDYIETSMIEIMHDNIIIDDYDICVCNNFHMDKNYNIIDITMQNQNTFYGKDVIQSFLKTTVFDSFSTCNKLYKSSIIIQNNIRFDKSIKWGEDYYFNYFFIKKADKITVIEDVLYNYLFERDGSATDSVTLDSVRRWELIKNILLAEENDTENYNLVLNKYASELTCISRELLRSANKSIIDVCYPEIVDEVKTYYNEFMNLDTINKSVKSSLKLIAFSKKIYFKIYSFYFKYLKR